MGCLVHPRYCPSHQPNRNISLDPRVQINFDLKVQLNLDAYASLPRTLRRWPVLDSRFADGVRSAIVVGAIVGFGLDLSLLLLQLLKMLVLGDCILWDFVEGGVVLSLFFRHWNADAWFLG